MPHLKYNLWPGKCALLHTVSVQTTSGEELSPTTNFQHLIFEVTPQQSYLSRAEWGRWQPPGIKNV